MNGNYIFHTFRLPIINNMILIMEAVGFCAGVLDKDLPQLNLCRHKSLLEYRLMIFLSADKISFRCSILVINRAVDLSQSLILFHTRCALGRNRTCDPLDRNQMLYPLSYKRKNNSLPLLGLQGRVPLNMQYFLQCVN